MKYHIEKNTVQETLVIPLFGRLVCFEHFPELFSDAEAKRICDSLDYDFAEKRKKMESAVGLFGALEVAQRQYDLLCEVQSYLQTHPRAAVVNLGCGLDDTFRKADNGLCRGYNLDLPDVIEVRDVLLPAEEREETQKKMAAKLLEKQKMMAAKLRKKGWSDEEIADFLDVELVDVRIWLDSVVD